LVVLGTTAFTNGNLDISVTSANTNNFATIAIPTSGKWYWEYQITTISTAPMGGIIIANASSLLPYSVVYRTNGNKIVDDVQTSYGATYTTTDIIGVAADVDGGTITFYKNGTSQGAITYASGGLFPAVRSNSAPDAFTFNFGQRAFANTAPSGFKALCTQNLPTPTIGATSATLANLYYDASLYTGTNATKSITNAGFQPDWVWIKARSIAYAANIIDSVRGSHKVLIPSSTAAEATSSTANGITSFNSNGFTLGLDTDTTGSTNASGQTFVAWQWKANGSGSTNTSGSITSTVSASTTSGFSVVTYTGTGSAATVGHGLGVALKMVIVKRRDAVNNWAVWQTSITGGQYLLLDTTGAVGTDSGIWNNTMPTSTVFSVGTSSNISNAAGGTYVAYCFAPIAGYSAFGSYTGNGSTDGPFVYTGFKPAFVMFKITSSADSWMIYDAKRNTYNVVNNQLYPNSSGSEYAASSGWYVDFVSNGFKLRATDSLINGSGSSYIYACFAENPFKYSLAR
jgi:hypothetical protein